MLALALAALQALAPMPPRALHDAGGQYVRLRTAESGGQVNWNAMARTVTLRGYQRARAERPERSYEHVVPVDFRPTAVAGMGLGRLAVAGRDRAGVCLELWRVVDSLEDSGPQAGRPTFAVAERRRVWELVEADSIGLLMWNPVPPAGAADSLRTLWHHRRELVRLDIDAAGRVTPTLEASMRGPTEPHVLQVPELRHPLAATFQAQHPERGLVLMLQTPCPTILGCCEGPELSLALLDGDLDGRLDGARRLAGSTWNDEDWGLLDSYVRVFE